ncbi:MAG TPA: sodium:proton antiporter [Deinococcales bacterium]|nr:sodium:proton antiporter [Deinococcales bacterium]
MEILIPVLIGLLIGGGVYMLLARALIRMIVGMSLISYGINLSILFAGGGFSTDSPPLLSLPGPHNDPVPQALILTAIVIGFGTTAFLLVVAIKAFQATHTDHVQEMAERPDPVVPPAEYADPEQPSISPETGDPGDMADDAPEGGGT